MTTQTQNPLTSFFRQPAIYVRLPSNGKYWDEGSIEETATGELPVLPMTTKDEIILRTPDALLNVIQSCIPSIKDAWKMPSIDVDAALIAIRIASYGENMEISAECPHCKHTNEYDVNLHNILGGIKSPDYNELIEINGLSIKMRPQNYVAINKTNQISFEEEKLIELIKDLDESIEVKQVRMTEHLDKMFVLGMDSITSSTEYIQLPDGTKVSNHEHILEFYSNAGSKVVSFVKQWLENATLVSQLPNPVVECAECKQQVTVMLTFDQSRFFV